MENEVLYNLKGEVPDEEYHIPLGLGDVKRAGKDVTHRGLEPLAWSRRWPAAELLAKEGIEAEVVDPRTLRPLDEDLIFESVRKTNRCVVVEEGWRYRRLRRRDRRPRAARVLRRPRRARSCA